MVAGNRCVGADVMVSWTAAIKHRRSLGKTREGLLILLASKKEFPAGATGQSGTAKVKFVIDRRGTLISSELVERTGSELLDAAALQAG